MNGGKRREKIIDILSKSNEPISGTSLAKLVGVSRQVVVQDMALLRAANHNIVSTNQGYVLSEPARASRVFKVIHTDDKVEEELSLIVDCGGKVEDVFVYHKIYDVVRGNLNIRSRLDIKRYLEDLAAGKSSLLKNITSGYHYHTVTADNEEILDYIQEELDKKGFLAKLQDYEPVNFWGDDAWN